MNLSRRSFLSVTALATQARAAAHTMQMHLSCGALGISRVAATGNCPGGEASGSGCGGRGRQVSARLVRWRVAGSARRHGVQEDRLGDGGSAGGIPARRRDFFGWPGGPTGVRARPQARGRAQRDDLGEAQQRRATVSGEFQIACGARFSRNFARVLDGGGLRIGIEYVAPKTAWASERYPFIHTMAEMRELIAEIGQHDMGPGNVGLVLDSWHWYHAGDSGADILALRASDVVSVDLNDAPAGVAKDQMVDNHRELPAATGIIDAKTASSAIAEAHRLCRAGAGGAVQRSSSAHVAR